MSYQSGCRGCEKRRVGCHSGCETYAKFRERVDRINEARRKDNERRENQAISILRYEKELRKKGRARR